MQESIQSDNFTHLKSVCATEELPPAKLHRLPDAQFTADTVHLFHPHSHFLSVMVREGINRVSE